MNPRGDLTSVEVFAGAGGLLLGCALAGFSCVAAVEADALCCETLRLNQRGPRPLIDPGTRVIEADVRDVDWSSVPDDVDLLAGGPPCQPFSLGGLARGRTDGRDMFPAYADALAAIRPRAFICENVSGLARRSFRAYLDYILMRLRLPSIRAREGEAWTDHASRLARADGGLRYEVACTEVDAADYGVPQRRRRVIIVGFRSDVEASWEFPAPTHGAPGSPGRLPWRTLGEIIGDGPDARRADPRARSYPGHTGSPLDEPCKTVKAGVHGVGGGENMIRFPEGGLRSLTTEEAARAQTFPEGYRIAGTRSRVMRQIGNAVPVELARAVATSVAASLEETATR